MSITSALDTSLEAWAQQGLAREHIPVKRLPGGFIEVDGQTLIDLSANDYLGLSFHPQLLKANIEGLKLFGLGSGGASAITGYDAHKQKCEMLFSQFLGFNDSVFLSNGYMANLSVLTSLKGAVEHVFIDKYTHASVYDALSLSQIPFTRYHHLDMADLEKKLKQSTATNKLIISEGVFSMTGALCPIEDLVTLKKRYQAYLMVDDAHAIGVIGTQGRGTMTRLHKDSAIDILVCPLGKAFSMNGAVVASNQTLINAIKQYARPYRYSTALNEATAYTLCQSLALIQNSDDLRAQLHHMMAMFIRERQAINAEFLPSLTAIQFCVTKDSDKALALSGFLKEKGFYVMAIRAPTVPKAKSGCRIVLNAHLGEDEIKRLLGLISEFFQHES